MSMDRLKIECKSVCQMSQNRWSKQILRNAFTRKQKVNELSEQPTEHKLIFLFWQVENCNAFA